MEPGGHIPKKDKDPNTMDVDRLSIEERTATNERRKMLPSASNRTHVPRLYPGEPAPQKQETKKKWDGKGAATHIRALVATMDEDERERFKESLETEGLVF